MNVEKFMKENSITESILFGLIDELSLNGFIKCEEKKIPESIGFGSNTKY